MTQTAIIIDETPARQLERRITAALAALQIPSLRRVTVEVTPLAIVLRGEVHSYYAKQVTQHSARRLAGDSPVIDEVRVATPSDFLRATRLSRAAGAVLMMFAALAGV